jgi:hypothetical protein
MVLNIDSLGTLLAFTVLGALGLAGVGMVPVIAYGCLKRTRKSLLTAAAAGVVLVLLAKLFFNIFISPRPERELELALGRGVDPQMVAAVGSCEMPYKNVENCLDSQFRNQLTLHLPGYGDIKAEAVDLKLELKENRNALSFVGFRTNGAWSKQDTLEWAEAIREQFPPHGNAHFVSGSSHAVLLKWIHDQQEKPGETGWLSQGRKSSCYAGAEFHICFLLSSMNDGTFSIRYEIEWSRRDDV